MDEKGTAEFEKRLGTSRKSFKKCEGYIIDRLGLVRTIELEESIADFAENVDIHAVDSFGNGYNIQHKQTSTGKAGFRVWEAKRGNIAYWNIRVNKFLKIGKADYFTFDHNDKLYIFNARILNLVFFFFEEEFEDKPKWKKVEIELEKLLKLYKKIIDWQTTGEGGEEILARRGLSSEHYSLGEVMYIQSRMFEKDGEED